MALKSIRPTRKRLADEVYAELIDAIKRQEIDPDTDLVQEKLAAEMQISRTPVREALLRLEQEGVIEVSRRGSFRLYRMTDEEVKELYQSRAAIEGQAARILCVRNRAEDFTDLRSTIEREKIGQHDSVQDFFEANRAIHRRFMELANNRFLLEMFDIIWGKATAFLLFATVENVDLSKSLGDHMVLVDAIENGDKTEALEVMTAHIHEGFDLQIEARRTKSKSRSGKS